MKLRFMLLIAILAILLTSCTVQFDSHIEFDRNYSVEEITYSESIAQYGFKMNMEFTRTDLATYYFDPSIEHNEREDCIKVTDKVLSSEGISDIYPEIYIFSQSRYDCKSVCDHILYSAVQDWESVEYVTDVLLAIYGESTHYGSVFGYANYLAKDLDFDSYDGRFSMLSVGDLYDLSYLCFHDAFASSDDVVAVKEIACNFVDLYISQHGEQAFQHLLSSLPTTLDALASYYQENDMAFTPSCVQFGYGGKKYDYLVYSDYATFYIAKDWKDLNAEYNPLVTEGFLHSDYAVTKAFFETNLKQMKQYQDLFALDDYNHDLDIVFTKPVNASKTSFYQGSHRIYLYNVDSLMHEYIHSLTMPDAAMTSWQVEGFARCFSYYYDFYGMALLNEDYNNAADIPELKYIHEYLERIGRPVDIAVDYPELENIAVYSRSWYNPNENYLTGSSFVRYLVMQYGEAAVADHIYGSGAPLPKTYSELVKEWKEYLEVEYAEYSKFY